jgi:dihydrofolate reductase
MKLTAIVAMSKNRVIGVNNDLPWSIPEDMKFFRETTKGHIMIMGRKTFASLGKPLPNRFHIVITRNPDFRFEDPTVEVVSDLKSAIELAHMLSTKYQKKFGDEVFVIGGGEIFSQAMELLDRIYLTVIEKEYQGDVFFPEFSEKNFSMVKKDDRIDAASGIPFSFQTYERVPM